MDISEIAAPKTSCLVNFEQVLRQFPSVADHSFSLGNQTEILARNTELQRFATIKLFLHFYGLCIFSVGAVGTREANTEPTNIFLFDRKKSRSGLEAT